MFFIKDHVRALCSIEYMFNFPSLFIPKTCVITQVGCNYYIPIVYVARRSGTSSSHASIYPNSIIWKHISIWSPEKNSYVWSCRTLHFTASHPRENFMSRFLPHPIPLVKSLHWCYVLSESHWLGWSIWQYRYFCCIVFCMFY